MSTIGQEGAGYLIDPLSTAGSGILYKSLCCEWALAVGPVPLLVVVVLVCRHGVAAEHGADPIVHQNLSLCRCISVSTTAKRGWWP